MWSVCVHVVCEVLNEVAIPSLGMVLPVFLVALETEFWQTSPLLVLV